jgi:S1-C subfamily serine protease/pSer/pThr/pTyr-binding forkhead associated (FHA) protein
VRAQFDVLSGARAGAVLFFGGDAVTVGRHPESDIQFHPQKDLAVSTHHALLFCRSGLWHVRDLSSRNGTFVNNIRITTDRPLVPGNRIRFGHGGPEVEFRYAPLITPSVEMAVVASHRGEHRLPETPSGERAVPKDGTSEQLRVQLTRETRRLRWIAAGLSLLLVVLAMGFFTAARNRGAPPQELRQVEEPVEGLLDAPPPEPTGAPPAQVAGVTEAAPATPPAATPPSQPPRSPAAAGNAPPPRAGEDPPQTPAQALARDPVQDPVQTPAQDPVQAAREAVAQFQATHDMDFQRVQGLNRRAVARLYVEMEDGSVTTGTGFAVRANGTLVTNRHVVEGEGGGSVERIGVQFADSEQVWPARFLIASPGSDLALVKVDNILGDVPVVAPLNLRPDTLPPGTPVALLGFPLGGDTTLVGEDGGTVIRPLLSPGLLEGMGGGEMVIQGYGAIGASGSPVMDRTGAVVGVVFGGRDSGDGHRLLAVPSTELRRLLDALPDASGR